MHILKQRQKLVDYKHLLLFFVAIFGRGECGPNQTDELSPLLSPDSLPFRVSVVQSDFQLPSDEVNSYGLQTFAFGVHHGKWLLVTGRTNGVHGFTDGDDNFPVQRQNTTVYVVDPIKKTVISRSLTDPSSRLSQTQIDDLSTTAAQFFQENDTLYIVGGYGIDTATGQLTTKSTLTAIDIPGLMHWVKNGSSKKSAAKCIRQTSHPLLQVTGGYLSRTDPHHSFLLMFGQNFDGFYNTDRNGIYTEQVRPFKIIENGSKLYVQPEKQHTPNPNYRRRDLNVIPIIQKKHHSYHPAFIALSGVFTPDAGIWTVPVSIDATGKSSMPDASDPSTFKQGMNNYITSNTGLYSKKTNEMFILLLGGLSYLYVKNDTIQADEEIPFINSITTVKIDSHGKIQQYLMDSEFPEILSNFTNFGNPLLFGGSSRFIPADNLPTFSNGVVSLDSLESSPVLLGYVVGGIQSTVPNTFTQFDSSSSPYIFSVFLEKN